MKKALLAFALAATAQASLATILTFEGFPNVGTGTISRFYGDNVTNNGSFPTGTYEKGDGWTPDVHVQYATYALGGWEIADELKYWQSGYFGGSTVAIPTQNGATGRLIFSGGYNGFTIKSIDLVTYGGMAMQAAPVTIRTLYGYILWTSGPISIEENTVKRINIDYHVPYALGQAYLEWGNDWNIGIDNVHFVEPNAVPEPSTMALGLGAALYAARRRSRLKRTH